ncbi:hypothetical protein [Aestuariivirga litoralis]|uniref:hypothetical protein n=1 Tax=Aestuariivirga litoralis TaxID=2650924 RepID=UPI0018C5AE4C|nr:hypothetical protein [Aestuariivirga litoralis]MBG1232139.1 hypothetical protein [Aestuariivirga litoralis]
MARFTRRYASMLSCIFATASSVSAADISSTDCATAPPTITIERSLAVNDASIISKQDFSFARTIGNILASLSVPNTPANRQGLVQTLLSSLVSAEQVNLKTALRIKVDPRPAEVAIDPAKVLDPSTGFRPVALFNRLDLAPADWNNCGEYRIVYAGGPTALTSMIFEASLKNPHPELGPKGCRPLVEFWQDLSNKSSDDIAKDLSNLYYDGVAGFPPVVSVQNYGMPLGQVRSNSVVGSPWQLREWKIAPFGPQGLGMSFVPVTVKSNPLAELYGDDSSGALDVPKQEQVRQSFHSEFLGQYLSDFANPELTMSAPNSGSATDLEIYRQDLINSIGAKFDDGFNEFQSNEDGSDSPFAKLGSMNGDINAKLATLGIDPRRPLTSAEIGWRATAVTCTGCHSDASDKPVAKLDAATIMWPPSLGFLQVSASGGLSPALTGTFLPWRQRQMIKFLCDPYTVASASPLGATQQQLEKDYADVIQQIQDAKKAGNKSTDPALVARFDALTQQLNEIEFEKDGAFVRARKPD